MRKALIGILMGAAMATPMAAAAQNVDDGDAAAEVRAERDERVATRPQGLSERGERRQERSERRAERRQDSVPSAEQRQERTEPRVERRREAAAPRTQDRARNWPGQTERADQVIADRNRRDRRDDRLDRREDRRDGRWDDRADRRDDRRDGWSDSRRDRRYDRVDRRDDRRDWRDARRDWNRGWRSDRRYDWQRHRYANRNIFQIGRYYSPFRGHSYSRFSIGLRLGSSFYSDRYWINDPWQYRLPPAYSGTRWVRYYDDVLLVDLYTGQVIDVIHDFFW